MKNFEWLDLQFFADGAGDGAGDGDGGADAGVMADDAGQQQDSYEARLVALGVPRDRIRSRAKSAAAQQQEASAQPEAEGQDAAASEDDGKPQEQAGKRMTWDEIMADPEYNAEMQRTVQGRVAKSKAAEQTLQTLAPALKIIGKKYGIDTRAGNFDAKAIADAVIGDKTRHEQRAIEMGWDIDTAAYVEGLELDAEAREDADRLAELDRQEHEQDQKVRQHLAKLVQQGEALRETFPQFDLQQELKNDKFAIMTSPRLNLSVEDAYFAVHHSEIQQASMQAAARKTAEKMSNALAAGRNHPAENGVRRQAASVATTDYRNMSRQQRDALKQRIHEAAARGEKIYPGR